MPRSAASPPNARIGPIATAVPDHPLPQPDVARRAAGIFGAAFADFSRLAPVYANAAIDMRYSSVPIEWYESPHGFGERNRLYVASALDLLERVAVQAVADAGLRLDAIDGLVVVSSSGISTPSLDALLMQRLRLAPATERLPVFGLGCAGGVLGLARTAQLARGAPDRRYLCMVVELCGLTFRHGDRSKSNVVATALFGDGAAATVVSCRQDGPALTAWGEHTWPDSLGIMGWEVADDGLKVLFSQDIPSLVRQRLRPVVDAFLAKHRLTLGDIAGFVCHPGGAKVVEALEEVFELQRGGLVHARSILRRYGNMSAATVLFVLRETLAQGGGGRQLLSALGPGFTAALALVEAT